MILQISTKDRKLVTVALKDKGRIVKSLSEENEYGSQALLPLILKLLRSYTPGVSTRIHSWSGGSKLLQNLKELEVETGPGSFTGLRVGVAVANALGFALGIPVNGKKIETELNY